MLSVFLSSLLCFFFSLSRSFFISLPCSPFALSCFLTLSLLSSLLSPIRSRSLTIPRAPCGRQAWLYGRSPWAHVCCSQGPFPQLREFANRGPRVNQSQVSCLLAMSSNIAPLRTGRTDKDRAHMYQLCHFIKFLTLGVNILHMLCIKHNWGISN